MWEHEWDHVEDDRSGGYMMAYGACCACGRMFGFNPVRVPSYMGDPICRTCIDRINEKRKELGNPLWPVPADAYEPTQEY